MSSQLVFRASFYIMLSVAAMIVCGDSSGSRLDSLLMFLVPLAGVVAFFSVDQKPQLGLPRDLANLLALGTLVLLFLEYRSEDGQLIRALGHWVIALQLIKYFLPKTGEDDWFLFLLGLTEVLIGTVVNQGDSVGLLLFVWALLAVWVLGLFFLQREAGRFVREEDTAAIRDQQAVALDPYQGLFDGAFLMTTLRVLGVTLLLGGIFFLILPRQQGVTRARASTSMARHISGFDEEVKLGQLGEILENDSVVMSVEFSGKDRQPIQPDGEPLFRGVALTRYEKGRWRRPTARSLQTIVSLKLYRDDAARKLIRQVIKLEPNDSPTLFAMRPVVELPQRGPTPPQFNPVDGTIFRPDSRGGYDYEAISDADVNAPQENEIPISRDRLQETLEVDPDLKQQLREIALPIVEGLPEDGPESVTLRARAVEAYLRDSRNFRYTLEMKVIDPKLDPVLDFLRNRHEGHCEYFGSALALLLRSIDIPTRMINGFKGGDWNELTQSMNVRQKHAHSWVEALVGEDENRVPLWITLDATPAADREESVARVGGVGSSFRTFTDMVRYVWVFYILGYDENRQNRLIYQPIRFMVQKVRESYVMLWRSLRSGLGHLFAFQSFSSFISIRGFIVSFIVLSMVALLARLAVSVWRHLSQWWRGSANDASGLSAGILFYRRLAQLLSTYDLERTAAETQKEFAARAARFLAGQGVQAEPAAEVPERVVDAFYRVRFGHGELDEQTLSALESDLDLLQSRLSSNP